MKLLRERLTVLVGPIRVAFLLVFRTLRHERVIPVLARPEFDVDPIVLILDSLHCHRPFLSRSRSRARTHTHGCIGTKEKRNRSLLCRGQDGGRIYRMTSVQSRATGCIRVYATERKERKSRKVERKQECALNCNARGWIYKLPTSAPISMFTNCSRIGSRVLLPDCLGLHQF